MTLRLVIAVSIVISPVVLSGCASPHPPNRISGCTLAIPAVSEQHERLWDAIEDTLRRHNFRLDRVDRRAGIITTMPEISQHFFEVWRNDTATRRDFWEATVNPIRRRVYVSTTREGDGDSAHLEVVVNKQRLSSPDRQFNSTGAAYQYFGDALPSTTGLARISPEDDQWLDLGRDAAMEALLLDQILGRAGLTPVALHREEDTP